MFDRIVVPTDGSEGAERAAGHARVFARAFGSTVHVVSVVDERHHGTTDVATDDQDTAHRERLERRVGDGE